MRKFSGEKRLLPEGKRKNDMVRPSFGEQGPHFIFQSLAWRIPGTGEPGGLPSVGSHRVGHD